MWGNLERWQSWSIVPDLKSGVLQGTVGSNPTLSAIVSTLASYKKLGY